MDEPPWMSRHRPNCTHLHDVRPGACGQKQAGLVGVCFQLVNWGHANRAQEADEHGAPHSVGEPVQGPQTDDPGWRLHPMIVPTGPTRSQHARRGTVQDSLSRCVAAECLGAPVQCTRPTRGWHCGAPYLGAPLAVHLQEGNQFDEAAVSPYRCHLLIAALLAPCTRGEHTCLKAQRQGLGCCRLLKMRPTHVETQHDCRPHDQKAAVGVP